MIEFTLKGRGEDRKISVADEHVDDGFLWIAEGPKLPTITMSSWVPRDSFVPGQPPIRFYIREKETRIFHYRGEWNVDLSDDNLMLFKHDFERYGDPNALGRRMELIRKALAEAENRYANREHGDAINMGFFQRVRQIMSHPRPKEL